GWGVRDTDILSLTGIRVVTYLNRRARGRRPQPRPRAQHPRGVDGKGSPSPRPPPPHPIARRGRGRGARGRADDVLSSPQRSSVGRALKGGCRDTPAPASTPSAPRGA